MMNAFLTRTKIKGTRLPTSCGGFRSLLTLHSHIPVFYHRTGPETSFCYFTSGVLK